MKKERKRKSNAEAPRTADSKEQTVELQDKEPVTESQSSQDGKIVPTFGKKQKLLSEIKKAYKSSINNQKTTETCQIKDSTCLNKTTEDVCLDVLKEINCNADTCIGSNDDTVGSKTMEEKDRNITDKIMEVGEKVQMNVGSKEISEGFQNMKENVPISDSTIKGDVENLTSEDQTVPTDSKLDDIQNMGKVEQKCPHTEIQNNEDVISKNDDKEGSKSNNNEISFSPLRSSSPVIQENNIVPDKSSCSVVIELVEYVIRSEQSSNDSNKVQNDAGNEMKADPTDEISAECVENSEMLKNETIDKTDKSPSLTENTDQNPQTSLDEGEPESEKSFELEEGCNLPGCDAKETDEITDSQLCSIDWMDADFAPPDKFPRKAEAPQFQDGTNIIKGLTTELSQLNQMILRTKRELEMARRQLHQGQTTVQGLVTGQRSRMSWNNQTSNNTFNRL